MHDDQIRAWGDKRRAEQQDKRRAEQPREVQLHQQAMQELFQDPRWRVYARQLQEWRDRWQDHVSHYTHALTGQRLLSPEQYSQIKRDSAYAEGNRDAFERALRSVTDHTEGASDATQQRVSGPELPAGERHEEASDWDQNGASGEAEPGGWPEGRPAPE